MSSEWDHRPDPRDGEAVDDTHAERAPEYRRIGPYRLVEKLGQGGMGAVHLGLDPAGRAVAIKIMHPHIAYDEDARVRLGREVATLSRVRHHGVAAVLDAQTDNEAPYIVTEYVPGPPLDKVIAGQGPLDPEGLHRLGCGLADALRAIHAAGVVHRDVKPANVLMEDGHPVLIDFGIAHVADDSRLTHTGLVMGTPGYISPELVSGSAVTPATDWWGWAATLAFAASGAPPFGRGPLTVVLDRVQRGEPDLTGVDPRLAPLLAAALAPKVEQRPPAHVLLEGLERFAKGQPVTDVMPVAPDTAVLPPPLRPADLPHEAAPTQPRAVPRTPPQGLPAREPAPITHYNAGANDRGRVAPPAPVPSLGGAWVPGPQPGGTAPNGAGATPMDPRIGRARHTAALTGMLIATVGLVGILPALAAFALLAWNVAARTSDRLITAMVLRRFDRGISAHERTRGVVFAPWHLLTAGLATILALLPPLVVAIPAAYGTALAWYAAGGRPISPTHPVPMMAACLVVLVMQWWGMGGVSLRRGSRSLARGIVPAGSAGRLTGWLLALVGLALVAWAVSRGMVLSWWPVGGDKPPMSGLLPDLPELPRRAGRG